jgi:heme-degrading monooxygenase HmoA
MIARITRMQLHAEADVDEVARRVEDVMAVARQQRGYRGLVSLASTNRRDITVISLWDSEEDATANEMSGYYQAQVARFTDIIEGQPRREHTTVQASDVAGIVAGAQV